MDWVEKPQKHRGCVVKEVRMTVVMLIMMHIPDCPGGGVRPRRLREFSQHWTGSVLGKEQITWGMDNEEVPV